jgi:hypothetical protein
VVHLDSILSRMARRERESKGRHALALHGAGRETASPPIVRKVDVSAKTDVVAPTPKAETPALGLDPAELTQWDADTRYVFEERLAVGLELGMGEAEAGAAAREEAHADHAKRRTTPANGSTPVDLAVLKLVAVHFKTDSPWKVWHAMGPSWQEEARRRVREALDENHKPTTGIFATPWNLYLTTRRTT